MATDITITPDPCGYLGPDQALTFAQQLQLSLCRLETFISNTGAVISPSFGQFLDWLWTQLNQLLDWILSGAFVTDIFNALQNIADGITSAWNQTANALGTDLWIIFAVAAVLFFSPEIGQTTKELLE